MFKRNFRDEGHSPAFGFRTDAARPLALLAACPAHAPTPLRDMPEQAQALGLAGLRIKDETARMGLGSFKALGGAFAVAQIVSEAAGTSDLAAPAAREAAAGMTFVAASAGNHGLSVAAGARVFGARAVIVLCAHVPETFADRIRAAGAEVMRVPGSYEESVAAAARAAETRGWRHLPDGSWEGCTEAPALVMEGYAVLAEECRAAFEASGRWPTHVFLQAGVGGLAAAMASHARIHWPVQPEIIVVEPEAAPCLLRSVEAGRLTRVEGPVSAMGRLDCKDASLLAFDALRGCADLFMTITDAQAEAAAKALAAAGLATTPSGAAGFAGLKALPAPEGADVMIIVSEGPEAA